MKQFQRKEVTYMTKKEYFDKQYFKEKFLEEILNIWQKLKR